MFPKSRAGMTAHRKHKRTLEVGMAIESIKALCDATQAPGTLQILEFGSGNGFQVPFLSRLGKLVASDIRVSANIRRHENLNFVQCSIARAPFSDGQFDVIFSNHVVEHIEDLPSAFRELQRIGKPTCVYAFSVPTNLWLALSIPTSYYSKLRSIRGRMTAPVPARPAGRKEVSVASAGARRSPRGLRRVLQALAPRGHGVTTNFLECYERFKIRNWEREFSAGGFSIVVVKPLLLYGPSEWPIVPTMKGSRRACSSVLFMMTKKQAGGVVASGANHSASTIAA
jgi:SAM-dependent methyltransferase